MHAAAEAGLDVVGLTDHDTDRGLGRGDAGGRRGRHHPGQGHRDQHQAPGRRGAPAGLPARPDLPAAGRAAAPGPRRAELAGAGDPGAAARAGHRRSTSRTCAAPRDGTAATGRPHVADALVALGVVGDRDEAFRRYLNPGRPAYVDRYAAPLVEMLRVVDEAGGVAVIAHPWGRHGPDRPGRGDPGRAGRPRPGRHRGRPPAARRRRTGSGCGPSPGTSSLVVTGSSDHHGTGKLDHPLGCNTTDPEEYQRLLDLAAAAAARSGRDTPQVAS